jgi:hypothetical protein
MRQIVTKIVTSSARPKVDISEHFSGVIGAMRTGCYRGWKPLLPFPGPVGAASSRDCSEAKAPHGTKVVSSYQKMFHFILNQEEIYADT